MSTGAIRAQKSVAYVPVPASGTLCGLPPPLSLTLTAPDRAPVAVGLNVTLMVQLPCPTTLLPQLLVWEKSLALVPAMLTCVM